VAITPAPPTRLVFGAQPAGVAIGNALPTVTVNALNANGNVALSDNAGTVTLAIASGPAGGAFTATKTTTANIVNGVASFSNLTLTKPGAYTFSETASGPSLTGPASNSFTIDPLKVASIVTNPSGFTVTFNTTFDKTAVNLYGPGRPQADVVLHATGFP